MPKLDLSVLKAAKGAAGAIKAMKGLGWSWAEPVPVVSGVVRTNLGRYPQVKASASNAVHNMGTVNIPGSGDGRVVVSGILCRNTNDFAWPGSVIIGGVALALHAYSDDRRVSAFVASIPRSALPSGSQLVSVTVVSGQSSTACFVSVEWLAGADAPEGILWQNLNNTALPSSLPMPLNLNTKEKGVVLAVFGARYTGTASPIDWSGLNEDWREPLNFGSDIYLAETAVAPNTETQNPRPMTVGNSDLARGGVIAIFFPAKT